MSASAAAQIMRQAEQVKNSITESGKPFSELWVQRQKLEDLYKRLLLQDLEYALDKKVEQDLWNHTFKNQISILQTQAKDKENQKKHEAQANLNLFLETASGFYLQFLQMICSTFKLDLPFRRRSAAFGMTQENIIKKKNIVLPKKSSCLYICCHCLVHLGDIARYRQQMEQAQTFYRHAANLSPNNGQPYNQLAILEASRGDKLSTVFYYVRSLAVRHPFPVAATNLEKFYSKLIKDGRSSFESNNLTVAEIIVAFLQFEALLHMSTDLNRASSLKMKITSSLSSHIKSQSLTAAHLTGIVAIAIFSAHQARCDTTASGDVVKKTILSGEEEKIVQIHISFIVKLLETLLQQTPKEDNKAKDFLTLSAIKVTFDWLYLNKDILEGKEFSNTSLWQDFCKLLNTLQWLLNEVNKTPDVAKYAETPLPEDADLRCFQPLEPSYCIFNFSSVINEELSPACERDLRCQRLIAHGRWIAQDLPKLKLIVYQPSKSIRTQFSTKKVATGVQENAHPSQPKSQRQNVAMQTIMKKQLQRKMEQEKSPGAQLPAVSEESSNQAARSHPDMSKTSPPGLLATMDANVNVGGSTNRQVGVIPVHHKGNTFKANLPPRLSAKAKTNAVSPRMLKKDDPSTRNRSNSNNSTQASAFANNNNSPAVNQGGDFPSLSSNPEEYPSLSADNYPALVGSQRMAASLLPHPNHHQQQPVSDKSLGGWSPFGAKQGSVASSSASSLLYSGDTVTSVLTPADGVGYITTGASQYSQMPQRHDPGSSSTLQSSEMDINNKSAGRNRQVNNQTQFLMTAADSGKNPTRVLVPSPDPNNVAMSPQNPSHLLGQMSPAMTAAKEAAQYRQRLPYNQHQQQPPSSSSSRLQPQQQGIHSQRHQLRQTDPHHPNATNPYSQQTAGLVFDPTHGNNQGPVYQAPASFVTSPPLSATSTAPSSISIHPRDVPLHATSGSSLSTTPRGMGRHHVVGPAQQQSSGVAPTAGGMMTSPNMPMAQATSGQVDASRMSSIGNQLMTNPAIIGYIPTSSMAGANTGKKGYPGNQASVLSGMNQLGPGATGRGTGPPPAYYDPGRMNTMSPYQSQQHYQQQQHYQTQQQQQQRQQQQQHSRSQLQQDTLDNMTASSPPSAGLLYKNIPMAGSGKMQQQQQQVSANASAKMANVSVDLDGSGAMEFDPQRRHFHPGKGHQGQVQGQALAQLLASQQHPHQQGFLSSPDAGNRIPPSFHGHVPGVPKPELMGLRPSPHFLEQHNHSAKQQAQPQSLMNTVIDPPFLQASGEYTLFNSANSATSWQTSLAPDSAVTATAAVPHRMKPGSAKGNRAGVSISTQMDSSSNMTGMWNNSGPSPLERLLQQQRNQRQGDG